MAEKSFMDKVKGFFTGDDEEEKKDNSLKAPVTPPPPPPSTTTTTVTSTKKTTPAAEGPSELGKKAAAMEARFNNIQSQLDKLPAFDRAFFQKRLDQADKEFNAAKGNLENREAIERISHALSQLGAGLYGLKTGTDMSGLKFDKQDWDKKLQMSFDKLRHSQQMTQNAEREARDEFRDKKQTMLQQAGLYGNMSSNLRAADSRDKNLEATLEKITQKTEDKADKVFEKKQGLWNSYLDRINSAKTIHNPELVASRLKEMALDLGADPKKVEEVMKEAKGWGGLDEADARDAATMLNELVGGLSGPVPGVDAAPADETPAQPETVERVDPKSGKTAIYDAKTKQFLRWK